VGLLPQCPISARISGCMVSISQAFCFTGMRACICRKEVFVGQAVLNELKRIIEDSEVR
jgi:hypothetical protein